MHSELGVKTFVFSPSPRTLLALLHLFAPFFTSNRLKSGALQWGEGRKTKNGCEAYAREAERSPHAFTPFGRFSFTPFSTSRGGEHGSHVFSDVSLLSTKNGGGVFGSLHGGRRSVACAVVRPVSFSESLLHKAQGGVRKSLPFVGTSTKILYFCSKTSIAVVTRRRIPTPYEETAVSPSQRRRLLPHHQ
jgi:hypothetical protein